jgi:ribose 1,5-bisphosphokinase
MNRVSTPAGTLVLVVGASGVGKDTLLNLAKDTLAGDQRFRFVRRIITRPSGGGENSEFIAEEAFHRRVNEGQLALHWQAHGLFYGLPASINGWLAEGRVVIANGSRSALSDASSKYARLKIVNIVAAPELLAARLARRGREGGDAVSRRLLRGREFDLKGPDVEEIDNSGPPGIAAARFVSALLVCAQKASE